MFIKQVNATATAVNKIPLGLNFTAKALTVDAQGNPEELKGVTVTVKVDGEKDGIIKAGKNNVAAESALVIEIKETTAGAVKKLDGLAFEIVAAFPYAQSACFPTKIVHRSLCEAHREREKM